jgi:LysM repeat protein
LLARIGGAAVVITLLVPVVMGFTSGSDDSDTVQTADAPIAPAAGPAPNSALDDATVTAAEPNVTPTPTVATATAAGQTPAPAGAEPSAPAVIAEPSVEATDPPSAEALVVAPCGDEYEIAVGDFWIRIADGAGVEISDLLAVNDATSDTPLYPGRTICLPVGADTPPPPPTTPSTSAPTASTNNSSSGSTNRGASPTPAAPAPRTTTAPTTTAAPPTPPAAWSASADQVQTIIRDVWPDELEDRALEIAWRESNYRPTAKNNCCYGVFQIYWSVHRSWLADLGITSAEQLFDPTLNARAALTLYQRAGGWGPWGG